MREMVFDVRRRLSKSALLLQVGAGRSDSLTVGIENRDLIMIVALAVKHEFVPAIAMCAGCHSSFSVKLTSTDPIKANRFDDHSLSTTTAPVYQKIGAALAQSAEAAASSRTARPVYGWFTEGFDTIDLKEAMKAILGELAS